MTQTQDLVSVLGRYAAAIDREIQSEFEAVQLDDWLHNVLNYHFGWLDEQFQPVANANSGKKLRPVMALLAYQGALESLQTGGGKRDLAAALPLAACLEMIHNYSLIHDDIEDEDVVRRGRATLWAVWGRARAINAGDCLNMLAFRKLYRSLERGVKADRLVTLATTITDTTLKLTVGQDADISFEQDLDVTPDMYLKMIGGKTAALISCATYCGALLALDPHQPDQQALLSQFSRFGEQIGLGFQMRDDILGIWGLTADTGKHSGSDIRRRKKSLPIIFALSHTSGPAHAGLLEIYRGNAPVTPAQEQFVMSLLDQCQAQQYCQSMADQYKQNALLALETAAGGPAKLAANPYLCQLRDLSTFLVERDY